MNKILDKALPVAVFIAITAALYGALIMAPTERTMGDVQRIFYFHLGCAFSAFLAFTLVAVFSVLFLIFRNPFADKLALAAGEVGVLFCTLVLVTGPMWARPVWGKWWVWDPRLTTTLILWFLYVGYLVLRNAIPGYKGAVVASVYAVLAYVDVPIVYFSVRWWRGIHPQVIQKGGGGLDPGMVPPLLISLLALALLAITIMRERVKVANLNERLETLENITEERFL